MRGAAAIMVLLALAVLAPAAGGPDELTPERRKELEKKAVDLSEAAGRQYAAGDYAKAAESFREARDLCRTLYPRDKYPQGHPDLALCTTNLARSHLAAGEYSQAGPLFHEALAMRRALYPRDKYPQGHPDLIITLSTLAELYRATGEYGQAELLLREALGMCRALFPRDKYPQGHLLLAAGINNLAELHRAAGEYGKAEPLFREALDIVRALYPREKYPQGHPYLAIAINNLATLYRDAGEYGKAEPLYTEALDLLRALYPKEKYPLGHLFLATGINNLASLHYQAREYGKAEPLLREALDMYRALFPKEKYPHGHPEVARSINNLAELHREAGEYDKAEPLYGEALEMCRALFPKEKYPQGHPLIALSINNLARLHLDARQYPQAEALFREALAMRRSLYPKEGYPQGHPDLAASINDLASLYAVTAEYRKAEPLDREALGISGGLLLRYAELAAEAEGLNYFASQPASRDGLLSVTRHPEAAAPVYDILWGARATLTRLQQRRHRLLMASRDKDTAGLAEQLRLAHGDLARRLLRPDADPDKQRQAVQQLTNAKEDLEKRIARQLKLADPRPLTSPPVKRLVETLPADAAFVDLYRYTDFAQDPAVKGKKGEKRTPRYVAFVIRRGRDVARVELGEAAPIEAAWAAWRQALTAARPDEQAERRAATALAKLVWEPLRQELPATLKTVYLTPDGVLHQVPWAALPGREPGAVLLEEYALCLVPHGPFLLERLEQAAPGSAPAGALLAVGGVDYDGAPGAAVAKSQELALRGAALGDKVRWPALDGTDVERRQVAELARRAARLEVVERSGPAASTEQLQRDLPAARYAHIATHGFFADPKFRSAMQLDPGEFERASPDRRGGARSPLTLSGLVLAGANRTGNDTAEDRGIITAEGLIGLRLEGMELAVLSACETGLGDWGGGEGVYGLQRAFHVAGCRNVIASLWKVDDGATQALMALFYRNLWEKKLDAAEALRQAQLTLYRHPEAIQAAQKRGFDFTERDLPRDAVEPAAKPKHSPTAQWAAFTFSGVRPAPKPSE